MSALCGFSEACAGGDPPRNLWLVVYDCEFDYGGGAVGKKKAERLEEYVLTKTQDIDAVFAAVRDNAHHQRRAFVIRTATWLGEVFSPHEHQ